MSQSIAFASGDVFMTPFGSAAAANPTPLKVGILQDISIDISATNKSLFGKLQFPVAVRRGQSKIQCKAKFANFNAKMINDVFFGSTLAAGKLVVVDEAGTPTSNIITVTHSATWQDDLGVIDVATGQAMTKHATPAVGQYSVAAGVYTFNASDTTAKLVSYTWTATSTTSFALANLPLGASPLFSTVFNELDSPTSNQVAIQLLSCVSSKLTLASKIEDFLIPEFDFDAFADSSGNVFNYWGSN